MGKNDSDVWHRSLGHPSPKNIKLLINGLAMDIDNQERKCVKQRRKTFRTTFYSSARKTNRTYPFKSMENNCGGSKYFIIVVVDFSRMAFVYFLLNQDQVRETIEEFISLVEVN